MTIEPVTKRYQKLASLGGVVMHRRNSKREEVRATLEEVRFRHMGKQLLAFVEVAASSGCPVAMNLLAQWRNIQG